ncbi:MAG: OmpA family protein [Alphaproteobacteria bacterium]|nr:OmpA family protein [Alphaproteobacteria bacterium]MCW5741021.1 OmpA family protein [Alphaproteobacteria bacterium]
MGRGLALAIMLLAAAGAGLAFVKPWGWPRGDLIRAQNERAAAERAALEQSLLQAKADLARATAAKTEADRLAGMDREQAERKLTDLETHVKGVMARAVDAERALAAAQAAGAAALAKAKAEMTEVREELARAVAARDALATRLASTQEESQRAIAQARDEAARARDEAERARAGRLDNAAEAELEKRLAAARTEAAERFMEARNEADRQITAAQADAARCRADLEQATAKLPEPPPEPTPAAAPACDPAAAAEPASASAVIPATAIAQQLATSGHISLYVPFDTGSAVVKPNALPSIEPIAAALRQDPKLKLLLVGHTDSQGDFGFNRQLSENRAKAIVDQLIAKHGIDRARLAYAGVADLSPIATNDTDTGRQRNRRVELVKR